MITDDTAFTIVDVETTGLNPKRGDRIVEIAGVRVEGGVVCEEKSFVSLVRPERSISWEASCINKIKDEDLVGAPLIAEVLPSFLRFVGGSTLVAHNAQFDLGFLEAEKEMCWGYVDIPECLCTMQLSRALFPHEYRHNLNVVSARFNLHLPQARHRALPDVLLTAKVFLKLIEYGKISSLSQLREKAAIQSLIWR
jgi:DNA polymerase III subunit epsilon